jgi:predicted dinucleotide-binding enzyme
MDTFGMIFAGIGAAAIIGALGFVSLVIGGLVNAMILLQAGPLVDKLLGKKAA